MSETYDLILRGADVVNHDGRWTGDIAVSNGRIAAMGRLGNASAPNERDMRGLTVLPGVIDSQVHFREPGGEQKEDLETGSRAAVAGGVTAVFEMPNTNPTTTTVERLADKVARARHRMFSDFAFYVGGTHDNVDELAELERCEGAAGTKVFIGSSTGDLLIDDEAGLEAVIKVINRRAAFHCEDEARLKARADIRVPGDASSHPVWRDAEAALIATKRLVGLAEKHGKRVHVLHISTAEEMPFLAAHKEAASVEVTPHHLSLGDAGDYERLGTKLQMNPPVRDAAVRDAIWAALRAGVVDVLGSDHAPHTLEEKAAEYPASPSGMPGVQTLVPIMLDHVHAGRLSLERFVDLTSHGPQRLFGISGKGRIAVGYDADFTIVDLKRQETITDAWIESRCGWTPYDGKSVTGWPVGTVVRGAFAMWQGELAAAAAGEPVRFQGFQNADVTSPS